MKVLYCYEGIIFRFVSHKPRSLQKAEGVVKKNKITDANLNLRTVKSSLRTQHILNEPGRTRGFSLTPLETHQHTQKTMHTDLLFHYNLYKALLSNPLHIAL